MSTIAHLQEKLIRAVEQTCRSEQRLILHPDGSTEVAPSHSGSTEFVLFSSGTTGDPKPYVHRLIDLEKSVKRSDDYRSSVWGLLFPVNHLAGLSVVLQAVLNESNVINLFAQSSTEQLQQVQQSEITHISATPTLYRQWLATQTPPIKTVQQITLGGESVSGDLIQGLHLRFPSARLTNIYALTEAGTLLKSKDEWFEIPSHLSQRITIQSNEIYLHSSHSKFATGDQVELDPHHLTRFKIVGRKGNGVNIGGYWVSPTAVENQIRLHPSIKDIRITSRTNSVLGNILAADIIFNTEIDDREFQMWLEKHLPPYQIPRFIQKVDTLPLTRSGKIKR